MPAAKTKDGWNKTALGRSDIVVSLERYTYIIEFKMGSAQDALDQIEKKQYYAPYLGKNKTIILLGIGLSEKERNIIKYSGLTDNEIKGL